jgi:hypothetical protein
MPSQPKMEVLARREAAHTVPREGVHSWLIEGAPGCYLRAKVSAQTSILFLSHVGLPGFHSSLFINTISVSSLQAKWVGKPRFAQGNQ